MPRSAFPGPDSWHLWPVVPWWKLPRQIPPRQTVPPAPGMSETALGIRTAEDGGCFLGLQDLYQASVCPHVHYDATGVLCLCWHLGVSPPLTLISWLHDFGLWYSHFFIFCLKWLMVPWTVISEILSVFEDQVTCCFGLLLPAEKMGDCLASGCSLGIALSLHSWLGHFWLPEGHPVAIAFLSLALGGLPYYLCRLLPSPLSGLHLSEASDPF